MKTEIDVLERRLKKDAEESSDDEPMGDE